MIKCDKDLIVGFPLNFLRKIISLPLILNENVNKILTSDYEQWSEDKASDIVRLFDLLFNLLFAYQMDVNLSM